MGVNRDHDVRLSRESGFFSNVMDIDNTHDENGECISVKRSPPACQCRELSLFGDDSIYFSK